MPTRHNSKRPLGVLVGLSLALISTSSWATSEHTGPERRSMDLLAPPNVSLAALAPVLRPMLLAGAAAPETGPSVEAQLEALDARIEYLTWQRSKTSLAGPIVLMAAGGGLLLASTYVLLLDWVNGETCGPSYAEEGCWNHDAVRLGSFVGMTGGAGMLLGGGLWLGDRVGTRRAFKREIDQLRRQRDHIDHLDYTDDFARFRPPLDAPHGTRMLRLTFEL